MATGTPVAMRREEVIFALAQALRTFASKHGGIAFAAMLDAADARYRSEGQPDLGFVAPVRMTFVKELVLAAPDLVVDVVDSASRRHVRLTKLPEYARRGVREAWVVDPELETTWVFSGEGGAWVREQSVLFGDAIPSGVLS